MQEQEMQDTKIQRTGGEGGDPSAARTNYIIYFVAAVLPPAALVGVIMAYSNRSGDGGWVDTHYRFQIRTFWLSLLLSVVFFPVFLAVSVVAVMTLVLLPLVPLVQLGSILLVWVWWVVRAIKGYNALNRGAPHPAVTTWLW